MRLEQYYKDQGKDDLYIRQELKVIMEEAVISSEYADQLRGYTDKDLRAVFYLAVNLAKEFGLLKAKTVLLNTPDFLKAIGDSAKFAIDQKIAELFNLGSLDLPTLEDIFDKFPEDRSKNFNRSLRGFEEIKRLIGEGLNADTAIRQTLRMFSNELNFKLFKGFVEKIIEIEKKNELLDNKLKVGSYNLYIDENVRFHLSHQDNFTDLINELLINATSYSPEHKAKVFIERVSGSKLKINVRNKGEINYGILREKVMQYAEEGKLVRSTVGVILLDSTEEGIEKDIVAVDEVRVKAMEDQDLLFIRGLSSRLALEYGSGAGNGLYAVKGIVNSYAGELEIESSSNETSITVLLDYEKLQKSLLSNKKDKDEAMVVEEDDYSQAKKSSREQRYHGKNWNEIRQPRNYSNLEKETKVIDKIKWSVGEIVYDIKQRNHFVI
ncbi:MAG: ATP-binding protein [Candidatus Zapsychrus exili]|nr:ATP-binding protein [Candidatus Zapsychrus exili]